MASLPDPPPGVDLTETKVPLLVSVFAVTWVLGVVTIGLRILARKVSKNELWWDDWLIIISLLWSGAFLFDVTCYMVKHGFGLHVWVAPPEATKVYFLGLFIAEFTYTFSLAFIKWSILAFYRRIFGIERGIRWQIWIMSAIVCVWAIAVILATAFQCLPTHAFWNRFDPVHPLPASEYVCGVDVHKFFKGNAIPNIITDMLIILIPLPFIWKLYLPLAQKAAIMSIFIIGIFVTIVSTIRLTFVLALDPVNPDSTWYFSNEIMWTGVEVNIATVCACLPSLKPILNLILYGSFHHRTQPSRGEAGHNTLVIIGGTSTELDKNQGRRNPQLNPSAYGASTALVSTSKKGVADDTHPFAQLTDNDSDTWQGTDGGIELEGVDESGGNAGEGDLQRILVTNMVIVQQER